MRSRVVVGLRVRGARLRRETTHVFMFLSLFSAAGPYPKSSGEAASAPRTRAGAGAVPVEQPGILRTSRILKLGENDADTPLSISKAEVTAYGIVILDVVDRSIRVYSTDGRKLIATIGGRARGATTLMPSDFTTTHDTIIAAVPNSGTPIVLYNFHGARLGSVGAGFPRPILSVATVKGAYYAGLGFTRKQPDAALVFRLGDRKPRIAECPFDPTAVKHDSSMIAKMMIRRFSRDEDRVYCYDVTTPDVKGLDEQGRRVAQYTDRPRLYVAPPETKRLTNPEELAKYESQWTAHTQFFTTRFGYISVFQSTLPNQPNVRQSVVFLRDTVQGKERRIVITSTKRIVGFRRPDTLLALPSFVSRGGTIEFLRAEQK